MGVQAGHQRPRPDVVLDASVLFQEPVRSLLLWLAAIGAFRPAWSELILEETRRNLIKRNAVTTTQWVSLRDHMTAAFPDALIDQELIAQVEATMPNDPKDRHVLAAAVVSGAPRVVTNNLKHFKNQDLTKVEKESIGPDDFLCEMLKRTPNLVEDALRRHAAVIRRPRPWTVPELLGRFAGLGRGDPLAPCFAVLVEQHLGFVPAPPPEVQR